MVSSSRVKMTPEIWIHAAVIVLLLLWWYIVTMGWIFVFLCFELLEDLANFQAADDARRFFSMLEKSRWSEAGYDSRREDLTANITQHIKRACWYCCILQSWDLWLLDRKNTNTFMSSRHRTGNGRTQAIDRIVGQTREWALNFKKWHAFILRVYAGRVLCCDLSCFLCHLLELSILLTIFPQAVSHKLLLTLAWLAAKYISHLYSKELISRITNLSRKYSVL